MQETAKPLDLGSSDQLGPLPQCARVVEYNASKGYSFDAYTAEQMLAYASAAVAAERERLKADAEQWGEALNAAGWEAIAAYRRHTGQVDPVTFFNHANGIVRDALAAYFKALGA